MITAIVFGVLSVLLAHKLIAIAVALMVPVAMGVRMIEGDEHYGHIGAGQMTTIAADTFSIALLPAIIEPDFIVKAQTGSKLRLEIDVKDVLVWDARELRSFYDGTPDGAGSENLKQRAIGGLVKNNTVDGTGTPTADTAAQGTHPSGAVGAVTGGAGGTAAVARTNGDEQPTDFVDRWTYWQNVNEEQTAVGQIQQAFESNHVHQWMPYDLDGVTCHYLMTAAHYAQWFDGNDLDAAGNQAIGFSVRRVSVDLKELMFDRAVILSILDALVVSG